PRGSVAVASRCSGVGIRPGATPPEQPKIEVIGAGETALELVKATKDPEAKWRAIRILGNLWPTRRGRDTLPGEAPATLLGDVAMPPAPKPLVSLLVVLLGAFLILGGCVLLGSCLLLGLLPVRPGADVPQASPAAGRPDTGPGEPRPRGQTPPGEALANPNVRFGLPAPAKTDPASREAFLLDRPQYVLSYNAETHTPNWVCWRLQSADIGHTPRQPFEPDPDLPRGFARVTAHDYDGTGFDRGHICPAKDRSATEEDSKAVFFMTNIVPQAPNCNQRGWERLEDYCRRLAK